MNRKVLGAESVETDGIKFRSRLEARLWSTVFKPSELDIRPEPYKITLQDSFKPVQPFYIGMMEHNETQRKITYAPDFVCYNTKGKPIGIIEIKGGYQTDRYPLKKKMILKVLEKETPTPLFFEVHNKREAEFCINKLKELI